MRRPGGSIPELGTCFARPPLHLKQVGSKGRSADGQHMLFECDADRADVNFYAEILRSEMRGELI